jgi:hypothetical protein
MFLKEFVGKYLRFFGILFNVYYRKSTKNFFKTLKSFALLLRN